MNAEVNMWDDLEWNDEYWKLQFDNHMYRMNAPSEFKFGFHKIYDTKWHMLVHKDESDLDTLKRLIHAIKRAKQSHKDYYDNVLTPYRKTFCDKNGNGRAYVWPTSKDKLPARMVRGYTFCPEYSSTFHFEKDTCPEEFFWDILSNTWSNPDDPEPGNIYEDMDRECHRRLMRYGSLSSRLRDAAETYTRRHFDQGPLLEVCNLVIHDVTFTFSIQRDFVNGTGAEKSYIRHCELMFDNLTAAGELTTKFYQDDA